MNHKIKYNPDWEKRPYKVCCYFCGETRRVKYIADLCNLNGERVLTVDVCNRCAPKLN